MAQKKSIIFLSYVIKDHRYLTVLDIILVYLLLKNYNLIYIKKKIELNSPKACVIYSLDTRTKVETFYGALGLD